MIYEGNCVTPKEEYEGKAFLAPDGCTFSKLPIVGWNIVDIPEEGKEYRGGEIVTSDSYFNVKLKNEKIKEVVKKFDDSFLNGLESVALGVKLHIKLEDQLNYTGAMIATQSLSEEDLLPLPLIDFYGKEHVGKTLGQVRAAYLEVVQYKGKVEQLRAYYLNLVNEAKSVDDLNFEVSYN